MYSVWGAYRCIIMAMNNYNSYVYRLCYFVFVAVHGSKINGQISRF